MTEPKAFVLEEPFFAGALWMCTLYTTSDSLIEVARTTQGLADMSVWKSEMGEVRVHLFFSPRYDTDTVWLELYEALTQAAKFTSTWSDTLDNLDMKDI